MPVELFAAVAAALVAASGFILAQRQAERGLVRQKVRARRDRR